MLTPEEAHREIDELAETMLPRIEDRFRRDLLAFEALVHSGQFDETREYELLTKIAEQSVSMLLVHETALNPPQAIHVLLGGTSREVVNGVRRAHQAARGTLDPEARWQHFSRAYHALRDAWIEKEAAIRCATADDARIRAIGLQEAWSRTRTPHPDPILTSRIDSVVEDTHVEFEQATATLDRLRVVQGEQDAALEDTVQEDERQD